MEVLVQFFNAAGLFGAIIVCGVGIIGSLMGLVQTLVGRTLNLWPLQIATMLMTGVAGLVCAVYRLLGTYLQIGVVVDAEVREAMLLEAFLDGLLVCKVTLVLLLIHVIVSSIGRVFFVNGAAPARLRIPGRGAAVKELKNAPHPTQNKSDVA